MQTSSALGEAIDFVRRKAAENGCTRRIQNDWAWINPATGLLVRLIDCTMGGKVDYSIGERMLKDSIRIFKEEP